MVAIGFCLLLFGAILSAIFSRPFEKGMTRGEIVAGVSLLVGVVLFLAGIIKFLWLVLP